MKNLRHISFLGALFYISVVTAQKIVFDKVSISENDVATKITGITQDPMGYMWFSSNGISKFDGYQVTRFINDPLNTNSIASNEVNCIYADENTVSFTYWVASDIYIM